MGINLYKMEQVNSGECINCLKCIDVCPRNNPKIIYKEENFNPAFASSIAIVAFATLYGGSNVLGNVISANSKASTSTTSNSTTNQGNDTFKNSNDTKTSSNSNSPKAAPSSATHSKYKNGTYAGTGYGYMSNINVSVSINNDKITNVKVVSSKDSYQEPVNVIPQEIVKAQSSNVDAVSGATHTSNGIMSAAADALNKAKG